MKWMAWRMGFLRQVRGMEGRKKRKKKTLQDVCLTRSSVYSFILLFVILSG